MVTPCSVSLAIRPSPYTKRQSITGNLRKSRVRIYIYIFFVFPLLLLALLTHHCFMFTFLLSFLSILFALSVSFLSFSFVLFSFLFLCYILLFDMACSNIDKFELEFGNHNDINRVHRFLNFWHDSNKPVWYIKLRTFKNTPV